MCIRDRYRQALEIKKKVHGDEHPGVAIDLNNLALFLRNQDPDSAEAARLGKQARVSAEKTLDPDHPHLQEYPLLSYRLVVDS